MHLIIMIFFPCILFSMLQLVCKPSTMFSLKRQHVPTCPAQVDVLMLPLNLLGHVRPLPNQNNLQDCSVVVAYFPFRL